MQQLQLLLKRPAPRSAKRLLTSVAIALLVLNTTADVNADDDDRDDEWTARGQQVNSYQKTNWIQSRADVAPVANKTYQQECGACHMAYQPGLLPASAWATLMTPEALMNHYGDDASLAESVRTEIQTYLIANAADYANQIRAQAFAVPNNTDAAPAAANQLPRITTTHYFQRKHDEIPARLVKDNPQVGSFSQCNKCHGGADQGIYNEHEVIIPGAGAWQD